MSENVQAKYDIVTLLASLKYTYFDNAWLTEMLGYLSHYLVNKEGVFNWTAGYYKELPQEEVKGVYNRLNDELKTYSLDYGAAPSTGEDYVPFKEDDVKATKDLPSFTSIENLTAGLDAWATGELLAGEEGPAVPRSHVPLSYGTGSAAASSGSAAANHEGEIMANKFLLGGRRRRRRATRRRRRTQRRRRATKVRRRR